MWGGGHDVAAAVHVAIIVTVPSSLSHSSLHRCCCPFPPHEQLLTAAVGGSVVVAVFVVPSPGVQGRPCLGCGVPAPMLLLLLSPSPSRPVVIVWSLSMLVLLSTHDPPCEQWLTVVVAGAGSLRYYPFEVVVMWQEYGGSRCLPCGYLLPRPPGTCLVSC